MAEIYRLSLCYVYTDDYLRAEVRGNGVLVLKIFRVFFFNEQSEINLHNQY